MDPELASMMRVKPAPLTLQQEVQLGSSITVISPAPDGTAVAVGTVDEQVIVYDAQLQHTASCSGHEGGTNGLAWLPGNRLASVGEDGSLRVWAADSGEQLAEVACEGVDVDKGPDGHSVTCLAVNSAGDTLVAAAGKTLHILPTQLEDSEEGRRLLPPVPGGVISDARFVGDTRLLLAYYGGVALVSTVPGVGTLHLEYGTDVLAAAATPNLSWLVGGCMDASVHIWHFSNDPDALADAAGGEEHAGDSSAAEVPGNAAAGGGAPTPAAAGEGRKGQQGTDAKPGEPQEVSPDDDASSAAASAALGVPTTMVQFACGGYETKVVALAFDSTWLQLASAGGTALTVWPFDGPTGPAGAVPVVTLGHERPVTVLGWQPCAPGLVASGGKDGYLLLYDTSVYAEPDGPGCPKFCGPVALAEQVTGAPLTALAWTPQPPARRLYSGDDAGRLCCWELPGNIGVPPPPPGGPPAQLVQASA